MNAISEKTGHGSLRCVVNTTGIFMRIIYIGLMIACALVSIGCEIEQTEYVVRIENISQDSQAPSPLTPGVFVVHDRTFALFVEGEEDRGLGLESLAEDGNPAQLAENVANMPGVFQSGIFAIPIGQEIPGPLLPGRGSYEFAIVATEAAQYLSFATMLVESNDLFFAPSDAGIRLFRFGGMIEGDVTHHIQLWDAKTEVNEAPGAGAYQPERQIGPDTGTSETGAVRPNSDSFIYPSVDEIIRVTITPQ